MRFFRVLFVLFLSFVWSVKAVGVCCRLIFSVVFHIIFEDSLILFFHQFQLPPDIALTTLLKRRKLMCFVHKVFVSPISNSINSYINGGGRQQTAPHCQQRQIQIVFGSVKRKGFKIPVKCTTIEYTRTHTRLGSCARVRIAWNEEWRDRIIHCRLPYIFPFHTMPCFSR